ncbi:hypothetical protein [Pseudomonas aeruginosa]|uniref:hypothetical protein n=1 Tax=Pseudomonas aeruginosa TaxID=287 RepID=UPI001F03E935|nr:hypothetical protein [Pseudomonas aeruginosa]
MLDISVVFKVPAELAGGLANGTLERVGGVIRDSVTKKVVAWLREGDMISYEPPSEILNSQLSQLMGQGQMLMGLQVANLAVSAVGFAMIYRKLQGIERQLVGIDSKVMRLQEGQDWLDTKQLLARLAPLGAAMQVLREIPHYRERSHVTQQLLSADRSFSEAQTYFHQVLLQTLNKGQEYRRAEEFGVSYRAWLMAGQGRMQAMSEIGEQDVAFRIAESLKSEHAKFGKRLTEVVSDPLRRLSGGQETIKAGAILQQIGQQAVQAHQILRGNVLQLEFMREHRLLPSHERDAACKGHSGLLVCLPA